jgi:hypothetical protein
MAVLTALLVVLPIWILHLYNPFFGLGLGLAVGFIVPGVRFAIWKRRHPIITPEDYLDAQRKAAPWN